MSARNKPFSTRSQLDESQEGLNIDAKSHGKQVNKLLIGSMVASDHQPVAYSRMEVRFLPSPR